MAFGHIFGRENWAVGIRENRTKKVKNPVLNACETTACPDSTGPLFRRSAIRVSVKVRVRVRIACSEQRTEIVLSAAVQRRLWPL